MLEWRESGGPIEQGESGSPATAAPSASPRVHSGGPGALLAALASRSFGSLLRLWLGMVLGFGALYWIAPLVKAGGLLEAGGPLSADRHGLAAAVYFSFVTATSVGFGDVVPVGPLRILAILEGAAGLLLFGCIISKLVSRRHDELIEEIHHIAFEDRLGRVRTNLHLALSELQSIAVACSRNETSPDQCLSKLESAAMIFSGELRALHELLYRPAGTPEEPVLEAMLANVAAGLEVLSDLTGQVGSPAGRSSSLGSTLRSIRRLAGDICGECVPREYAPDLKSWMDRVQELASRLPA